MWTAQLPLSGTGCQHLHKEVEASLNDDHIHGRPDSEEEHYDDLLGRGAGDPDLPSGGKWIGVDMPEIEITVDNPHWSELPPALTRRYEPTSWYDSDNDARSPLEADLEDNGL